MLLDSILPHPVSSGNECNKKSLNIETDMLFLLFKNAKDSSYNPVIVFDTGTVDANKERSIGQR